MIKTSMNLEESDIEFIRSQGFTMSGFLRFKINELKNKNGIASGRKDPKVGSRDIPSETARSKT